MDKKGLPAAHFLSEFQAPLGRRSGLPGALIRDSKPANQWEARKGGTVAVPSTEGGLLVGGPSSRHANRSAPLGL